MNHWQFSQALNWHGKGFTLHWNFPDAWLVLVHYHNGEQKAWYRSTERGYRFRRWFLKKGKDQFQNLAHFSRRELFLFVFKGFSPFPEKIRIPMDVRILRVQEPEAVMYRPWAKPLAKPAHIKLPEFNKSLPSSISTLPELRLRESGIQLKPGISDLLASGFQSYQEQQKNFQT